MATETSRSHLNSTRSDTACAAAREAIGRGRGDAAAASWIVRGSIVRGDAADARRIVRGRFPQVQGCLSILLLPAIEDACARAGRRAEARALSCFVAIYPLYNILKRAILHARSFAASSFANNGAEWAIGFLLGLAAGHALAGVLSRWWKPEDDDHAARTKDDQDHTARSAPNDDFSSVVELPSASPPPEPPNDPGRAETRAERVTGRAQIVAGVALCCVSVVSAILFGVTWDNTAHGKHDDAVDAVALVFIAVPTVAATAWLSYSRWRGKL